MAERNDLNVPVIASVGAVCVLLTIATVFAVQALYFNYAQVESQRKVIQSPTRKSDSRIAEQDAVLARYGWVSQAETAVSQFKESMV